MSPRKDAGARIAARLAARTSHDLNNILAIFSGHLYLLRESAEPLEEGLDAMEKAIATLHRLSRSLADLGALAIEEPRALDVNQAARQAASHHPEGTVELDLAGDLPEIVARPADLERALAALLVNAREASPAGSKVRLSSRLEPDGGVRLVVEDSGPGLPAEVRRRNLDPFFSTKEERGRGIGIAVAATTAALGAGEFTLEDREGGGTRATLRFPGTEKA